MDTQPIYLQAVKIENAQSHTKTIYEFAPNKINVLAADNGVGKSVFFKMLEATLTPKSLSEQDRFDLIRHGCEYAQITYLFSDGAWGACRIYLKSIVYNFAEAGVEKPYASYDIPDALVEHLNILMDANSKFITNIINTKQNLLLVDSSLKSNYQLLKLIACDDTLQDLLEKLPMKIEDTKRLSSQLDAKLSYIRQRFDSLKYVDEAELRYQIRSLEAKTDVLYQSVDSYKLLESIEALLTDKLDFDKLLNYMAVFEKLAKAVVCCSRSELHSVFDEDDLQIAMILEKLLCIYSHLDINIPQSSEVEIAQLKKIEGLLAMIKVFNLIPNVHNFSADFKRKIVILDQLCSIGIKAAGVRYLPAKDYKVLLVKINELFKILCILKSLEHFDSTNLKLDRNRVAYKETLAKIKESNCTVQCKLYGEVIFDGEHCTPVK